MSSVSHGPLTCSPRNKSRIAQEHNQSQDEAGPLLSLNTVIGTTTSSSNAFDALSAFQLFAYCAGPAVIVSRVDENFDIKQRLYRAKPNASSVNSTTSFYSHNTPPTTPSKSRYTSNLKDALNRQPLLEKSYNSPISNKPASWNREAACLALSRNGKFLAVGEV